MTTQHQPSAAAKVIPGLNAAHSEEILSRLAQHPAVEAVVLYGSRALGRHRPGSDIDLCLQAPWMRLNDLLLPWPIELQLHQVGITLWHRPISTPS